MKIYISGATAHLEGDWTASGVTRSSIDTLIGSLQQIERNGAGTFQIDCRRLTAIDAIGLECLDSWVQFARLRNVKPELINLPDNLQQSFQSLGVRHRYTSRSAPHQEDTQQHHPKRRYSDEIRRDKGNR